MPLKNVVGVALLAIVVASRANATTSASNSTAAPTVTSLPTTATALPSASQQSSWIFGSSYSWTLSHSPAAISYCATYDLCDIYYIVQATDESYTDSGGSGYCFDFPGPSYHSGSWEITFDMGEDFTFTKWRVQSKIHVRTCVCVRARVHVRVAGGSWMC